jgi:hypothetical protein
VVAIEASAHVQELRLEREARARTATTGGGRTKRHDNLPEGRAEPGVTYRDVEISITIPGEIDSTPRRS